MSPTLGHQLGDPPPEPHTSLSSIDQEKHRGRGRILRWAPLWVYSFISSSACACAHASALVLKDLGPRLALIHTVGPVITLANKSSSLTTLSHKQMHCDQSEWCRPLLRVWTYLASVSKELQPFKPLLHTLWVTSTKHHGIGLDTVNMETCCTHSLNQACQGYNKVSIAKWQEDDDVGGYRDYADTPN